MITQPRSLQIVHGAYGQPGRVDLNRTGFGPLTLGGFGWIESSSLVACWNPRRTADNIAVCGHANDGPDGAPLEPTMDYPF